MLVRNRALERLDLRVRVGEVAGEGAVPLDALAGERLQLRAHALELAAQALLLLGLGAGRRQLRRQALVALGYLAQLLLVLAGGLGQRGCKLLDPGLRLLERACQVRSAGRSGQGLLEPFEPCIRLCELRPQLRRRLAGLGSLQGSHAAAHLLQLVLEPRVGATRDLACKCLHALARVRDGPLQRRLLVGPLADIRQGGLELLHTGARVAKV
jgi:hypothetical protein